MDEYLNESRKMYFDYNDFTPGPIVVNQDELEEALLAGDMYYKDRISLKEKVFDNTDYASEKLYHKIQGIIYKH
jgi:CDP-glycerol glycerophosphotransferase (TagB/SpsB family)